ncbi:MAG: thioredoxin family protein [Mycoplasmoidaceae bacterium]
MELRNLNDQNHDEIVKSKKIVILKFGAEWCGVCNMIDPEIKGLADDNKDITIAIGDIDEDNLENLKIKYNIQSIPHIVFYKDGVLVEQFGGYKPKSVLQEIVNKYK